MLSRINHRKLLAGHTKTVERFLDGLESLVFGIACGRYRLRREDAEDLLLEVLHKLWDKDKAALRTWRGQGSLKTWLSAIVHRCCLMELRRRERRPVEQPTERLDSLPAAAPPDPLASDELRRLYREAATDLAERDRRLIEMRFVEERDYPAIMAELGISHGAARKALHTAIGRLRERLRQIAPDLFDTGGRT